MIALCAEQTPDRQITWINREIASFSRRFIGAVMRIVLRFWKDDVLVGGLYGVALGTAFFGESMFSRARDTSKMALVYLVALLRHLGFTLLDTQFLTDHLSQFGAMEMTRANYHLLLDSAVKSPTRRFALPLDVKWPQLLEEVLQPMSHTS